MQLTSILVTLAAATVLSSAAPLPLNGIIEHVEKRFESDSPWIWRGDASEAVEKRDNEKRFQGGSPWIWQGDAGEAVEKRDNEKRFQDGSPWIWQGDAGEAVEKRTNEA